MIRLELPSGAIVEVGFRHRRTPMYAAIVDGRRILSVTPLVEGQSVDHEIASTEAAMRIVSSTSFSDILARPLELRAVAEKSELDTFCYYEGRYQALRHLFEQEKAWCSGGQGRLLTPDDRMALLQFFALKRFTPKPAERTPASLKAHKENRDAKRAELRQMLRKLPKESAEAAAALFGSTQEPVQGDTPLIKVPAQEVGAEE